MSSVDLEVLDREECVSLLASREVGRLGFLVGDQPIVLPVNYTVDGETIVVRTDLGTKQSNVPFTRVAFEVDEVSGDLAEGWSVLVQGVGQDISTSIDPTSEHLRALPLTPWAPGPKDHWLRIVPREITGRRLRRIH